jgi:hypothetical protein
MAFLHGEWALAAELATAARRFYPAGDHNFPKGDREIIRYTLAPMLKDLKFGRNSGLKIRG